MKTMEAETGTRPCGECGRYELCRASRTTPVPWQEVEKGTQNIGCWRPDGCLLVWEIGVGQQESRGAGESRMSSGLTIMGITRKPMPIFDWDSMAFADRIFDDFLFHQGVLVVRDEQEILNEDGNEKGKQAVHRV